VTAYAEGRAHARMPPWVVAVILGFLALFILAIALAHVVLFPGIIVLAAVIYGIVPYRAVAGPTQNHGSNLEIHRADIG
jgi:hypothetical protein